MKHSMESSVSGQWRDYSCSTIASLNIASHGETIEREGGRGDGGRQGKSD